MLRHRKEGTCMKKLILAIITASLLSLTSCGQSKDIKDPGYFKEYSFNTEANREQIVALKLNASKLVDEVSQVVVIDKEEGFDSDFGKEYRFRKETTKFVEDRSNLDHYIAYITSEDTLSWTNEGLNIKTNSKTDGKEWDAGKYFLSYSKTTENKNTKEEANAEEMIKDSKTFKQERISYFYRTYLGFLNGSDLKFYVKSDGSFVGVISTIKKTTEAYEWLNEIRDYIEIRRDQYCFMIDQNCRLTSFYRYSDIQTNIDRFSNEWRDKVKIQEYQYVSYEFEYGKKTSATIAALNNSIKNKNFLLGAEVHSVEATATFVSNKYLIDEDHLVDSAIKTDIYLSAQGYISANFEMVIKCQDSDLYFNACRFYATGLVLHGAEEVVEKNYPIDLNDASVLQRDARYTVSTTDRGTYLVNRQENEDLRMEFVFHFDGSRFLIVAAFVRQ